MPFNGSGVFQRVRNWVADAAAGIKIRADYHDSEDDGFALGLSNCITKDGQTTVTQNIPFNSKRITGLADPINPQDAATKASVGVLTSDKVSKLGDTMSGDLTITKTSPTITLNTTGNSNGNNAAQNTIFGQVAGKNRWGLYLGSPGPETGSDTGSDLFLYHYNDAGDPIELALLVHRDTGLARVKGDPTDPRGIVTKQYADARVAKAGDTMTGALAISATTPSTSPITGALTVAGGVGAVTGYFSQNVVIGGSGAAGTGALFFGNTGGKSLQFDGAGTFEFSSALQLAGHPMPGITAKFRFGFAGGGTQYGIAMRAQADTTYMMVFNNASDVGCGSITQTPTTVSYNTSSDGRLKEDLKPFDAGSIVDNTDVYDFKWKSTGERAYGVIGQQAIEVYPHAVTHYNEEDGYGVDYSKYVPVLLQELKALRARMAQLEGRTGAEAQKAGRA